MVQISAQLRKSGSFKLKLRRFFSRIKAENRVITDSKSLTDGVLFLQVRKHDEQLIVNHLSVSRHIQTGGEREREGGKTKSKLKKRKIKHSGK